MKAFILLALVSFSASAVELKFIGPCTDGFIMKTEVTEDFATVGDLTIATLSKFGIPFQGTPEGLSSAFNTPTGEAAIERVSATETRAYGWCFAVNGVSPDVFPHQVTITPDTKSVTWTYGFARMKNGQWVSQCEPAYTVKPASLCIDPTVGPSPLPSDVLGY